MSSPAPSGAHADPNLSLSVSAKVMLSGVIFFFFLFVSLLIFFLRANRYIGANPSHASTPPARFLLPVSSSSAAAFPRRALDLAVLRSLPLTVFSSVAFKEGAECAVCLSELAEGDPARFLPGCLHGFHLACIDMWFRSHSTCPICRSPVELQTKNITALCDSETVMPPIRRLLLGSACSSGGRGAEQGVGGEGSSSNKNCQRDSSLVGEENRIDMR